MQASRRDLENFLKWLPEAETTVNVLGDASQRDNALQDTVLARELPQQLQASAGPCTQQFYFHCALSIQRRANLLPFKGEVVASFGYEIRAPL